MTEVFHGEGPAAVVIIHAWPELDGTPRVRMRYAPPYGENADAYATSVDEALDQVRRWLTQALQGG